MSIPRLHDNAALILEEGLARQRFSPFVLVGLCEKESWAGYSLDLCKG